MWIRLKSDGTAIYVADVSQALGMIDAGNADAVDEVPERPEIEAAVISPPETAVVEPAATKPKPKLKTRTKR